MDQRKNYKFTIDNSDKEKFEKLKKKDRQHRINRVIAIAGVVLISALGIIQIGNQVVQEIKRNNDKSTVKRMIEETKVKEAVMAETKLSDCVEVIAKYGAPGSIDFLAYSLHNVGVSGMRLYDE